MNIGEFVTRTRGYINVDGYLASLPFAEPTDEETKKMAVEAIARCLGVPMVGPITQRELNRMSAVVGLVLLEMVNRINKARGYGDNRLLPPVTQ